ncbi:MAG: indole acetimide hydrolase, partial [Gammaproteobacteria bacterium]|nr:indole acetimide hydrolase [Gammaproteobacteria bacterium]
MIVKDSVHVAGMPSTAGTPALGDFQPHDNAPVIQSLLDAGAIVLGKTNLHELSLGFTTNNAFTGATLNPHDFGRIPGGSSGGNGAALAANFAPLALGEDTT